MKIDEYVTILLVLIFTFVLSVAVLKTAAETRDMVDNIKRNQEVKHLPTECAVYYNDGTDRWKECMQVGIK